MGRNTKSIKEIIDVANKHEGILQELVRINEDPNENGDHSMAFQELVYARDFLDKIETLKNRWLAIQQYGKDTTRFTIAEVDQKTKK